MTLLADDISWFVDVKAESLHEHLNTVFFDLVEHLKLVLHVQDKKLVLFVSPVRRVLQHKVLNVDETFLDIVIVK